MPEAQGSSLPSFIEDIPEMAMLAEGNNDGLIQPRKLMVLVVEDNDTDFLIVSRMLRLMDTYDVEASHAPDLQTAFEMARKCQFNVIFVDYWLGLDTGVSAINELGGRLGAAPTILLTGMMGQDIRQIGLQAGAINCLDKNELNPVLLETTIRYALHTHSLEAKLNKTIVDLRLAVRSNEQFFERIGSDLKDPIGAIIDHAKSIQDSSSILEEDKNCSKSAQNIHAGGAHLLQVFDNLIHHSKKQTKTKNSSFEKTEIGKLIEDALLAVNSQIKVRKHDVKFVTNEGPVFASCQPSDLGHAIVNVLSNAIKYTSSHGQIDISLDCGARYNEICIRDNGRGMNPEEVDVALRRFESIDCPAETSTQGGIGLGLPIAVDILAHHRGQIDIDSKLGKGTTVILRVPCYSGTEDCSVIPLSCPDAL